MNLPAPGALPAAMLPNMNIPECKLSWVTGSKGHANFSTTDVAEATDLTAEFIKLNPEIDPSISRSLRQSCSMMSPKFLDRKHSRCRMEFGERR